MGSRNGMNRIAILLLSLSFFGCSEKHAGGNTAETGNPDIAGMIRMPDGTGAAYARVQCIPLTFNPLEDTLKNSWATVSDSTGHFHLDSLTTGICNLEAFSDTAKLRLLLGHLSIEAENTLHLDASLSATGTVRLNVTSGQDGDSGTVVIPGTSIIKFVQVKFSSVFVDSLPPAQFDTILYYPSGSVEPLVIAESITAIPGDTINVNAPAISYQFEKSLNTTSTGAKITVPLIGFPYAWVIDSTDLDFSVIKPGSGTIKIYRGDIALGYSFAQWDASLKQAVIWVRIDTLQPNSKAQSLRFEYSETGADSNAWALKPFSLQDSSVTAWHFDESSDSLVDYGPFHLVGVRVNTESKPGRLGKADWFDGRTSYITIPGTESGPLNFSYDDPATFSVWVSLDAPNTSRFVFGKGETQYYLKYYYPGKWLFENNDEQDPTNYHWFTAPMDTASDVGSWVHLTVVVRNNERSLLYVNGVFADSSDAFNPRNSGSRYTGQPFEIGRRVLLDGTDGQYFWGLIDELQVWKTAKSPQWIQALWANQSGKF